MGPSGQARPVGGSTLRSEGSAEAPQVEKTRLPEPEAAPGPVSPPGRPMERSLLMAL